MKQQTEETFKTSILLSKNNWKSKFNILEVEKVEKSFRRKNLEVDRNVKQKQTKNYVIQILKNKLKNIDFSHLTTKARFQIRCVSEDKKICSSAVSSLLLHKKTGYP